MYGYSCSLGRLTVAIPTKYESFQQKCIIKDMINNFIEIECEEYHSNHRVYTHPQHQHAIYIGDIQSATDLSFIQESHIHTGIPSPTQSSPAATGLDHVSFQPPVNHIVYPLFDMKAENISKFFIQFYDLVERQIVRGNILVHCAAGISRSSTLVIAYLMKKHHWSFKEAIAFVRKSRPTVCPNLGFERQLKLYETQLKQYTEAKNYQRRTGSKTSQQRKHNSLPGKQNILPDIGFMGRTQLKPKILDLFSQEPDKQPSQQSKRSNRSNSERMRPDFQFYGTRRAVFKPLKSKSHADRAPMQFKVGVQESPGRGLKLSMPVQRVQEVMARRLHLNQKKAVTERQLRIKPLHKLAYY